MARIERLLTWIVAGALFAMMALQFVDVLARKLLDTGIVGSVELIELMMLAVVFAGLPLASLKGEHVLFDMLDHWMPASLMRLQSLLANLICTVLLLGTGYLVLQRAGRTAEDGDMTARLFIGMAKFHYAIGILLLVTAGIHLWLALTQKSAPGETTQ